MIDHQSREGGNATFVETYWDKVVVDLSNTVVRNYRLLETVHMISIADHLLQTMLTAWHPQYRRDR